MIDGLGDEASGLLDGLSEIQDMLDHRERELLEHKAASAAAPAALATALAEARRARAPPTASAGQGLPPADSRGSGGALCGRDDDVEREVSEFARSIGYSCSGGGGGGGGEGIGSLWSAAQAAALDSPGGAVVDIPHMPPESRQAFAATDPQLRPASSAASPPATYPQSPPGPSAARSGKVADGLSCYPSSPSPNDDAFNDSFGYPSSPGRAEDWLSAFGAQGGNQDSDAAQPRASDSSGGGTARGDGRGEDAEQGGLPASVREIFRRAEALCERQEFGEAVPLFERVLELLEDGDSTSSSTPPLVRAEVWAHLAVAMQSLDRVPEAIGGYKRAVDLDPSLHVCFANLATLHAYMNERRRALEYIDRALAIDPRNSTYGQIKQHLEEAAASPSPRELSGDGESSDARVETAA